MWPVVLAVAGGLLAACDEPYQTQEPPARSPAATASATVTPASGFPADLIPATVTEVVDGDTIRVRIGDSEYPVRYIGIDTPETHDPRRPVGCFGEEAATRNSELVSGRQVGLERDVSETDQFGRLLRYVWITGDDGQPRMVNAILVQEGYAQAVTFPPDVRNADFFASLQREAREAGRGLWGPACYTPVPTGRSSPATGGCDYSGTEERVIKGNISNSSGEKIFHVPGQQYYEQTQIDESKGERWFCTEQEAIDAGWRKARV